MRLKITIAYDGRPFLGWQSQPGGDTVQDTLQSAAAAIAGTRIPIHGSGRTDTGVHALGQTAHFDAPEGNRMAPVEWRRALNSHLPPSIRILECGEAPPGFHARFSATEKEYHYRIHTGEILPPHLHGLVWHLPRPIDIRLLEAACRIFEGTHDFRNFAANRGDEPVGEHPDAARTTRTILGIAVRPAGSGSSDIELRFRGTGFLYKMVRLLTGSAVRCAQEKAGLEWLHDLLDDPAAAPAKSPYAAPAGGLYLVRVGYQDPLPPSPR
jgi:tRNA pseudouridine38-40 synthase